MSTAIVDDKGVEKKAGVDVNVTIEDKKTEIGSEEVIQVDEKDFLQEETSPTDDTKRVWVVEHIHIEHDKLPTLTFHKEWDGVVEACNSIVRSSRCAEHGYRPYLMALDQREQIEDEVEQFMKEIVEGKTRDAILINDVQFSDEGSAILRVLSFSIEAGNA